MVPGEVQEDANDAFLNWGDSATQATLGIANPRSADHNW